MEYRNKLLKIWHKLIETKNLSLDEQSNIIKFLADDIKIQKWNLQGLSKDEQSSQNAIIMHSVSK